MAITPYIKCSKHSRLLRTTVTGRFSLIVAVKHACTSIPPSTIFEELLSLLAEAASCSKQLKRRF